MSPARRSGQPLVYRAAKRTLDAILSSAALICAAPLLLLTAALIRLDSRGPALLRQRRVGRNGTIFRMYKFRTMRQNAAAVRNPDGSCFVGEDDPRLTRLGRWLRLYSIDELPQLVNVVRGEMSLVGPRPDEECHLALYDDLLRRKLRVKPGIASLASVKGRNSLTWRQRAKWEAWYVDHRCFRLDLLILARAARAAIVHDGVYYSPTYGDNLQTAPGRARPHPHTVRT